jgi:glutamate racemase
MIGIFDSGYGGLTVLRALRRGMPEYGFLYFGDNARAPYGSKSDSLIYDYAKEAVDFLFENGAGLILFACNTASAKALRKIQEEYLPKRYPDKKVLGVLIPAAEKAVELANNSFIRSKKIRIGIIGTKATISSGTYEAEIIKTLKNKGLTKKIEIISRAAPLLVPLVEEGWINKPETKMILRRYLSPLKSANIDILILGCTHYPILFPAIKRLIGKKCLIIDTPAVILEKLQDYLQRHQEIDKILLRSGQVKIFTSDDPSMFKNNAKRFFGSDFEQISISKKE